MSLPLILAAAIMQDTMKKLIVCILFILGAGAAQAGWYFERSLPDGAKAYGYQRVPAPEHPVRYGKYPERFEVRPGDCSRRDGGWDDCGNDRERSAIDGCHGRQGGYRRIESRRHKDSLDSGSGVGTADAGGRVAGCVGRRNAPASS